ncbi:MAG: alternative ribosome rescue aminoacyl-tRNA hydrolase ArfB [Aeromicrobium sp.]
MTSAPRCTAYWATMTHDGRLSLPESEMTWRFSRSSGAGGQHVNTTDTRVELIWSLTDTTVLSPAQKELAASRLANRLVDGRITVVSSQYRSQHRNREAARVRLESLVSDAVVPPRQRHKTKPTRGSKQRRLDAKKRRGAIKQGRSGDWE